MSVPENRAMCRCARVTCAAKHWQKSPTNRHLSHATQQTSSLSKSPELAGHCCLTCAPVAAGQEVDTEGWVTTKQMLTISMTSWSQCTTCCCKEGIVRISASAEIDYKKSINPLMSYCTGMTVFLNAAAQSLAQFSSTKLSLYEYGKLGRKCFDGQTTCEAGERIGCQCPSYT